MKRLFGRKLKIELMSVEREKVLTLTNENLYFSCDVKKYLSFMKDESIVTLYNLNKENLNELLLRKYDYIKIYAGYNDNFTLVALNKILVITLDKSDLNTPKLIIIGSAMYDRKRKNGITLNKGTSLYNALNLISRRAGIKVLIDNKLKNKVLKNDLVVQHLNGAIQQILRDYPFVTLFNDTGDLKYDLIFKEIWNSENTIIAISPENGTLIKDWISIDSLAKINFESLPVISYKIGSLLSIDMKHVNYSVTSTDQYLDMVKKDAIVDRFNKINNNTNLYVITALDYTLDPRGDFLVKVDARPYQQFQRKLIGGV